MQSNVPQQRLGFIGAGRVAQTLARAAQQAGWTVSHVASRHAEHAQALAAALPDCTADSAPAVVARCDLVLLTVSDDAIATVCASLPWRAGQAAIHCSGATEVSALAPAAAAGASTGGFHPLTVFADPAATLPSLPGCTVAIEAQDPLKRILEQLAQDLQLRPLSLPPGARARYHAAAHYAGAFLNALLGDAARLWASFGATEAQMLAALAPLARSTLNAAQAGGLAGSLPGVVSRGDVGTLAKHLRALDDLPEPDLAALYRTLALRTLETARRAGRLDPAQVAAIEALLRSDQQLVQTGRESVQ
ncbi:hypothetical protein IP84_03110 [beta proteobacterium AAP99]|nr:hypothetical protein IP84_03110 [beta proteobacterium AAP99]